MALVKEISLISDSEKFEKKNYRELPYNIEAEQLLLGIILINNEYINRVLDFLTADDFYEPVHARIYSAISKFLDKGLIASPITLKNYFEKDEALVDLGKSNYLAKLAAQATGIINILDLAKVIHDLSLRRKLIVVGEDIVNRAYDDKIDMQGQVQIEKAEHELFTIASEGVIDKSFQHLRNPLQEAITRAEFVFKNKDVITGATTGFRDIDKLLGGFHNSDLVIIAARPSMGKTALALNMAIKSAEFFQKEFKKENEKTDIATKNQPKAVGFFSLEMSAEQLASRVLSMKTEINSNDIRRGRFDRQSDFDRLIEANKNLHQLPFFIDETPAITISALRTRARRLKRKNNLGVLFIDYLQLIRGVAESSRTNRVQEVSEITQGLKAIAKELNIPIIALSQLSRQVEQRDDKKPQLADLRESGTIEQDSDIVMFIYREAYYLEREKPREPKENEEPSPELIEWQNKMSELNNIAEIIVAKHRNGPIGNVEMYFDKMTTSFKDLDKEHSSFKR